MKKMKSLLMTVFMLAISFAAMSQDPGGNPDGPPPAVPMDDYLLPILLIAGAVLSLFMLRKFNKKQPVR